MNISIDNRISIIELPASPQNTLEGAARVALQSRLRAGGNALNVSMSDRLKAKKGNLIIIERDMDCTEIRDIESVQWQIMQDVNKFTTPLACRHCKHCQTTATHFKNNLGTKIRCVVDCSQESKVCPDGYIAEIKSWRIPRIRPDYIRQAKGGGYSFVYVNYDGVEVQDNHIYTDEELENDGSHIVPVLPGQIGRQLNPAYFDPIEEKILQELGFKALNQKSIPATPTDNAW